MKSFITSGPGLYIYQNQLLREVETMTNETLFFLKKLDERNYSYLLMSNAAIKGLRSPAKLVYLASKVKVRKVKSFHEFFETENVTKNIC